ncbi:MAG: hypothetical protein II375_04465 [Bacteroidales bacterium]|nr:hypothetical protein [Bacteroidales bacterium]
MKNILVLNCGSSSIKYKLFEMPAKKVVASGGIEKIGMPGSFIKFSTPSGEKQGRSVMVCDIELSFNVPLLCQISRAMLL